ncbi:MAG: ribulokinase [Actinomycetota bacterium]|nr:ribulokinase [Actinomycetota bacterium]
MASSTYVLGIDFGTDSVRTVVVETETGREVSSYVSNFKQWSEGKFCNPEKNQFRQHPLDHIQALAESVTGALRKAEKQAAQKVIGIGVDTTGSTPGPIDREGNVLAMREDFKHNPNAMFILWKDHTAIKEAERINQVAKAWPGTDYTQYEGGVYSTEWFWSKILHVLREDEQVRKAAYSWVEHADWVPALLTGNLKPENIKRSRCAAGHKAMWHAEWGGLPPEEFLVQIDPLLAGLRDRLYTRTYTSDKKAGFLTAEWAQKLGLPEGIAVSVGAFDAHMGAVGAEIKEKTFVKILGTSCCDIAVTPKQKKEKLVAGICGQVDGSVLPEMIGLEAGQSSFGDVYAWFRDVLMWPVENILDLSESERQKIADKIIPELDRQAEKIDPAQTGLLALDWLNGRRTPYADQTLKGAIIGLTLGTTAPKIFRALVEATALGAKAIVERFQQEGIEIENVVGIGGISQKSPLVMQVLADVLNMPVKVATSEQAVALGAAMFGAVAAEVYGNIAQAQEKMGSGFMAVYKPDSRRVSFYKGLYEKYKTLGDTLEEQIKEI